MNLTPQQITSLSLNLLISEEAKAKILTSWDSLSQEQQEAILRLLSLAEHMEQATIKKVLTTHPEFKSVYDRAVDTGIRGMTNQLEKQQEDEDLAMATKLLEETP